MIYGPAHSKCSTATMAAASGQCSATMMTAAERLASTYGCTTCVTERSVSSRRARHAMAVMSSCGLCSAGTVTLANSRTSASTCSGPGTRGASSVAASARPNVELLGAVPGDVPGAGRSAGWVAEPAAAWTAA